MVRRRSQGLGDRWRRKSVLLEGGCSVAGAADCPAAADDVGSVGNELKEATGSDGVSGARGTSACCAAEDERLSTTSGSSAGAARVPDAAWSSTLSCSRAACTEAGVCIVAGHFAASGPCSSCAASGSSSKKTSSLSREKVDALCLLLDDGSPACTPPAASPGDDGAPFTPRLWSAAGAPVSVRWDGLDWPENPAARLRTAELGGTPSGSVGPRILDLCWRTGVVELNDRGNCGVPRVRE